MMPASPKELEEELLENFRNTPEWSMIDNVVADLQRHEIIPVTIFITEEQYAAVLRLHKDLTAQVQQWLADDIEVYEDLAIDDANGALEGAAT